MNGDNGAMQERPPSLDAFDVEDIVVPEEPGPPVYSEVTLRPEPDGGLVVNPDPEIELPHALVYPSQEKGTGNGHVVIRLANGDWTCICWPAIRTARGCHAMVAARKLLGLPPVE